MQEHTVSTSQPGTGRASSAGSRGLRRTFQVAAALAFAVFSLANLATTGCDNCKGGIVQADGTCAAKCDSSKCLEGNTCVDNKCVLTCTSHDECTLGTQDCKPTKNDDGKTVALCTDNGKAAIGTKCPFGNECDAILACPDGSACKTDNCKAADCKPLFCVTTGAGDADAYCTLRDCSADDDCAGGYRCKAIHDAHDICGPTCTASKCVGGPLDGNACSKDGDCQKGNNNFCGKTTEACIAPSAFTTGGTTYSEGNMCLQRNLCEKRVQCDPCSSDVDCSIDAGQHCTQVGAEKVCTRDCGKDADCDPDYKCDGKACVPRFGACTGTGKFCEPCRVDDDCKASGGFYGCATLSGGQRACADVSFPVTCSSSADCPTAPGGLHGTCLSEADGVNPGDPSYHICYFPLNHGSNKSGCWCAQPGNDCDAAAECCSGKCTLDSVKGVKTCRCKTSADCSNGYTCDAKGACVAP